MEASAKPKTYGPDEVEAKLKEHGLDDWYLEGDWIRRKYNTDGWPTTLMVVNAVGFVCEAAYHHADLAVTWGKLWVKLQNHAAGGITDKDFAVARQIEDTVLWRPGDDSPLEGTPNKFVFSKGSRRPQRRRDGRSLPVRDRQARGARAARRRCERAELPFDYDVAVMKITVAALMTADWIAKRLEVPPDVTRIMIPGMCQGDPAVLSERFDVPAEKGPADLKRLPAFFGQADARSRYGARDIRVFAEINNVPHLDRERIVEAANYYRDAGADVIDLGLSLDRNWLDEGPEVIADLKARGFTLSIDTLDPDEILMADAAGVDYVLSLNGHNRHVAQQLRATPVLIPDTPDDLDSLDATIAHLQELGKPFLVDPIIEPIGSGFAASLGRYLEVRRRHPDAEMLMGIGNLTELTEADTHRRHGAAARLLPGARHPQRADHRGDRLGARRGPRGGPGGQAHALRPAGGHAAQARRRPAAHDQGRGGPPLHGGRAARAAREHHRPEHPHLRGRRLDLRVQRRAVRQGHRHQPDLRRARRSTSTRTPSTWARSS